MSMPASILKTFSIPTVYRSYQAETDILSKLVKLQTKEINTKGKHI